MAQVVVDTSFAVRWGLPDELDTEADDLLRRARAGLDDIIVPPHFHTEVISTFYQAWSRGA